MATPCHTPMGKIRKLILFREELRHRTRTKSCFKSSVVLFLAERLELVVQEAPAAPERIRLESTSSKQVIISWKKPFNGHAPILNYVIQVKNISGELKNIRVCS
jgi:hypothetical protein